MNGRRDADAAFPLEIWDTFFVPDFHSTDRIFDPWTETTLTTVKLERIFQNSGKKEKFFFFFFFVNTFVSNFEFDFFLFEI